MKKCEFLIRLVGAVVIVLIALGAWAIVSFTVPPPSKRCGTPGGPPITAPRIRLSNGSYLAYQEHGDSRQNATLKIIFQVQCCCRHSVIALFFFGQGFLEENIIYVISYDRPGPVAMKRL
ncbi:unnamed protein product [Brassica napus]|uniref:(rape) hypothetical protein n=1 Tax=Brassica napus TaxID=3708 RepID=A0A816PE24_BRANA|nr:unnamed protein product [Brassica napus]